MNFWESAAGMVEIKMLSADPEGCLDAFRQAGVSLHHIAFEDPLTVCFRVSHREYPLCRRISRKRCCELKICGYLGWHWTARRFLRRPVLVLVAGMLLALTVFLSGRVLFVEVEGNSTIPDRAVLEAAEACGIRFGAVRREVRSEKMKNRLLQKLPQLQWAGINTSGCRAVISVRERQEEERDSVSEGLRYVVARRDGVITSCVVTKGNGLCAPGQAVTEGQVLISPYTDCGISLRVSDVRGEIFARTRHSQRAIAPLERRTRQGIGRTRRKITLLIGKKRINFCKGSGIWDGTCDRMYQEYYLTLPGGFRLPAGIAVESVTMWETVDMCLTPDGIKTAVAQYARGQLAAGMICGEILESDLSFRQDPAFLSMDGIYVCSEMIGREITQKIGENNGQISGEDR